MGNRELLKWLKDLIVCLETWEAEDVEWKDYLEIFIVKGVSEIAEKIRRKSMAKFTVLPFVTPDDDLT